MQLVLNFIIQILNFPNKRLQKSNIQKSHKEINLLRKNHLYFF